jgi:hypothetical protein
LAGTQRPRLIDPATQRTDPDREGGSTLDSWSETRSLVVLMTVIAIFYILGRVAAEML